MPRVPLLMGLALSLSLWLLEGESALAATPVTPPPSPTAVLPTPVRNTPTPIPTPTQVYLTNTPRPTHTYTPTPIATNTFWGVVEATAQASNVDPVAAARAVPSATRTPRPTSAKPAAEPVSVFGSSAAWIPPSQEHEERIRLTAVEARMQPTVTPTLNPALAQPGEPTRTTEQMLSSSIPSRMRISGPVDESATPGSPSSTPPAARTGNLPPPPPIRYAGVPSQSTTAAWTNASTLWLAVPHRSQFDGSLWAPTNCGPASLAMILEAYGLLGYATVSIRGEVNKLQGNHDPDSGTSLYAIASVAQRAGLYPMGLGKRFTIDEVRAHLAQGRPIITLTRYADLPGNGRTDSDINHYIVLSGLSGDNIIYNDSAYSQGAGQGLLISPETLMRAWANSDWPGHSVAFALNPSGAGLLSPLAMRQHASMVAGHEQEQEDAELAEGIADAASALTAQRELFWKMAILGITSRPLGTFDELAFDPVGDHDLPADQMSASALDPPFRSPWSLLSIVIIALLAASGTVTFAFMRSTLSSSD